MNLSLHPCSLADIDTLVLVSRDTFKAAFEAQNNPDDFLAYLNTAFSKKRLTEELKNSESHFFFVFNNEDLVGYFKLNEKQAQTDVNDETSYELERIYVITEFQGKGIGHWLIDRIINLALTEKKEYIWLGVWEQNTNAIRFYENKGFIKFGKHPYYIGQDKQMDWLMKLDLLPCNSQ